MSTTMKNALNGLVHAPRRVWRWCNTRYVMTWWWESKSTFHTRVEGSELQGETQAGTYEIRHFLFYLRDHLSCLRVSFIWEYRSRDSRSNSLLKHPHTKEMDLGVLLLRLLQHRGGRGGRNFNISAAATTAATSTNIIVYSRRSAKICGRGEAGSNHKFSENRATGSG